MDNWIPFTEQEQDVVWEVIDKMLKFSPSIRRFPGLKVPHPFISYDVSGYFEGTMGEGAYEDLEEKSLTVFQKLTDPDEYIYALDWQHECYWLNSHLPLERDGWGEWIVPIFPDGDYYFFIEKDFKWGFLGHPWERSITIFGEELLRCFEKNKPIMFQKILRQSPSKINKKKR
ncbi:DUF2716 domain-containing protein [Priestia koreensis]|uniref:DUF2716 domain-containing protein n=1 Tax=Priestia koreensis TaxID=284581 RepID=UPI0028F73B57|nr:DUF2716 domain-containing protein [Priestia koreensis]